MTTTTLSPDRVRQAVWAVVAVFAVNGMGYATWASRIPSIKTSLGLEPAQLGALLMCVSAGSLLGLPAAGSITARVGAMRTVLSGLAAFCVGLVILGVGTDVTHSPLVAGAGLFLVGLGIGTWDVSMNIEGAAVEQHLGRAIMPWFHAAFSGGTVVMALVAAGLAWAHVPVWAHLTGVALLWPVLGWLAVRGFLPRDVEASDADAAEEHAGPQSRSAWREPRTLLIGVVVLVAAMTEGTANDWVSVALVEGYHLPQWAGILGFATFLTAMTVGRLIGTSALDRYGRVPVLRVLFVLAAIGSLLVVFGGPVLAYVGAAVWGIGASLGFPVGMSAASDDPRRAAVRVSVVSTIGYLAFLAGPPFLGFLGNHVGVLHSLLLVGGLAVIALLLAPATREQRA
ncbi:MFS transporter [Arsenicicoccus sp. MKL-02]|uniref:MFS transporter n=1 Tax=Arsenicicoccus cauae TaxID=2663847 RepID=A0A6I3I4A3_9MICO|nr:MFS transporter [Arsenicicoccus cauae]MTB71014.1 MFS transporter [Arsenicicoccus cauae]